MDAELEFDPSMINVWPLSAVAPDFAPFLAPEIKSALTTADMARDAYPCMLNEMIVELRGQFDSFRRLRAGAEAMLAEGGDDAKTAKTDLKAATDALALIVRTLEKLDSLQRGLAAERAAAQEEVFDDRAFDAVMQRIQEKIQMRARELAHELHQPCPAHGPGDGDLVAGARQPP
jgi:hypothetical protein